MVARRHVLAQDHGIAPAFGIRLDAVWSAAFVELRERWRAPAEPALHRCDRSVQV